MSNPEFRRNVWIQFTSTRITVAGLLVGLLLVSALVFDYTLGQYRKFVPDILGFVAYWLALVVLLLWAGRQAAGAVLREIRARTWDSQRLSTLRPWTMAWGKLFGATSLAWVMALITAAAYVAAELFTRTPAAVATTVAAVFGYGIVCQATGLLASLARLSGRPGERGGGTTLAHAVGLVATGLLGAFTYWALDFQKGWFGLDVSGAMLRLVTVWFFALWAIVGVYRRMRRELQMQSVPWAWLLFLVAFVVYGEGLAYGRTWPTSLLLPTALMIVMLWTMTVIEAKDPLSLRQCFENIGRGRWRHAATLLPLWLITYVVFVGVVIVSAIFAMQGGGTHFVPLPRELEADVLLILIAVLLFLTRDVLIVQILSLSRDGNMAGLVGAAFWFVLYVAVPAVVIAGRQTAILGGVLPTGQGGWAICLLPIVAEVILCVVLYAWRWRVYWRENAAKPPAP